MRIIHLKVGFVEITLRFRWSAPGKRIVLSKYQVVHQETAPAIERRLWRHLKRRLRRDRVVLHRFTPLASERLVPWTMPGCRQPPWLDLRRGLN